MKTIVMTGGGTAGHVMAAKILAPMLMARGWKIVYLGSISGLERELIGSLPGITYYAIATGKYRRYFSWRNFTDIFRILLGLWQSFWLLRRIKPEVIFSGGGFVSTPVVLAGWLCGIPSVIRETDYTPGLANKIGQPFVKKVCVTFADTGQNYAESKSAFLGPIIRPVLYKGCRKKAQEISNFAAKLPTILVMGGSLGAGSINAAIRQALPDLAGEFNVIHLCGKDKAEPDCRYNNYRQFDFIEAEMADFYALADVVVTRCGSNALCEGMMLAKPMVMIPLSAQNSRGDQMVNARYAERNGNGVILCDEDLTADALVENIRKVYQLRENYHGKMGKEDNTSNCSKQIACLEEIASVYRMQGGQRIFSR